MTWAGLQTKAPSVHSLRTFLRRNRALTMFVVVAALCLKAAMPAGFMLETKGRVLTVALCSDASGTALTHDIVIPHGTSDAAQQAKAAAACPFTALSMAALGGADALLLAAAIAFILALGYLPAPVAPVRRRVHVLPPLRGPPALA